jgi:GGDEF domain-containing protein
MASLDPTDTETELFTRADLAMYEVKKQGGNRVHVWHGD